MDWSGVGTDARSANRRPPKKNLTLSLCCPCNSSSISKPRGMEGRGPSTPCQSKGFSSETKFASRHRSNSMQPSRASLVSLQVLESTCSQASSNTREAPKRLIEKGFGTRSLLRHGKAGAEDSAGVGVGSCPKRHAQRSSLHLEDRGRGEEGD